MLFLSVKFHGFYVEVVKNICKCEFTVVMRHLVCSHCTMSLKKALLTVYKQHDVFVIGKVNSAKKYCVCNKLHEFGGGSRTWQPNFFFRKLER